MSAKELLDEMQRGFGQKRDYAMNDTKVVRYVETADGLKDDSGSYVQSETMYRNANRWVTHADYRALEEKAARDALDAERWRWLVAENNKGGSRAKFLICWWSKDGDGYESTTGTSVDGHDPETIVRLIDATRTLKEQKK